MSSWLVNGTVVDWRGAIGELIIIHQHIQELDHERIWANELPRVAAKPNDIASVERHLRCELAPSFKAFLLCADGWRAFYQWVDLFGTEDLVGEPMRAARRHLVELDRRGALAQVGLDLSDLLPIAMTRPGQGTAVPDLITLVQGSRKGGQVFWLSDQVIDRYSDFDTFYLAMLDYNREEVTDLVAEAQKQGRVM